MPPPYADLDDLIASLARGRQVWRGYFAKNADSLSGSGFESLQIDSEKYVVKHALRETPATLVHGDWKLGNLGSHTDGRTVLLDWSWPGKTGPCVDLGWYLAVNCDRLPESKESTIGALRDALESHAIDTSSWWDRQLDLALVGAFTQLGWSKAGDPAEFDWWAGRHADSGGVDSIGS